MRRADRAVCASLFAFLLLGVACHSVARPADDPQPGAPNAVITNEELNQYGLLGGTAYEAVLRLRPGFLIDRTAGRRASSQLIQVSVNGGQFSGISGLNTIPASTVAEIRYLTVGEASQRFGPRASGPVILVVLMTR